MTQGVVRHEKPDVQDVQEALNQGERKGWRLLSSTAGSSPTISGYTMPGLMKEAVGVPLVLIWDTQPHSDQTKG
jgi:hypothetical protein